MKTIPAIRKPEFDWNGMKRHYIEGNFFATHFLNTLHVIFPDGEKFFVRSVKQYVDQIRDPRLRERVKGFIGQEMQHMNQHRSIWNFLRKQSPAFEVFETFYRNSVYTGFEDFLRSSEWGNKMALSITAALEHYTAIWGEAALKNDCELLQGIPEEMRNLLKWHAAEELEHKSVAYDVLQEIDDSYAIRIAGMIYASAALAFFLTVGQGIFLIYDKDIRLESIPGQFLRFISKIQPLVDGMAENLFSYFYFDFHPDDTDTLYLAKKVLAEVEKNQAQKKVAA